MNYKKMMGYSNSKKVTKKQSKPKKNKVLEGIKKELNEWNSTEFKNMPKRWSSGMDKGLTEFEKQGGKDKVNEGPAGDYENAAVKLSKSYHKFMNDYMNFERLLINKGLKPQARQLDKAYRGVEKFWKFYHKMLGKLM